MYIPIRYDDVKEVYIYDEKFSWFQLVGFSILFVGVIVYNELIEIPFWGFNQNTKEAIARRELAHESRTTLTIKNNSTPDSTIAETDWLLYQII